MLELKNTFTNKILRQLAIVQAVGDTKLFESLTESDEPEARTEFNAALAKLYHQGLIEIVKDSSELMHIVRLKVEYQ